jgi:hypothetical protein
MALIRSLQERKERLSKPGEDHRTANRLRRYFAPVSMLPPPGSIRGATGNRNVALTATNNANAAPTDSAYIPLTPQTGGAVGVWSYKTKFGKPPNVTATAVVINPNGPSEITPQGTGTTASIIIRSSDPNDTRLVYVQAVEATD